MGTLKRWWWVVAAAALVVVGTLVFIGAGGPASPTTGGGTPNGTGVTASEAVVPGVSVPSTTTLPPTPATPAATPTKIAADDAKLTTVTVPPKETLAQIRYSATRDGQAYDATFRLYGTGPTRVGHGTVVAAISAFTAHKAYSDAVDLTGGNALLELGPGVTLASGGTYGGVVTLMRRGDALVLVLSSVKAR